MRPPEYGPGVRVWFTDRVQLDVQWVMVGVRLPDGRVALFASTELGESSLRVVSNVVTDRMRVTDEVQTAYGYDLAARLARFVFVAGANYEEALMRLLAQWRPGTAPGALELGT